MKKHSIKYIVNTILFIDICSIAVIGLLLAFVIPEGRVAQASKYFLGLHRHDWGNIHLYLSLLLLIPSLVQSDLDYPIYETLFREQMEKCLVVFFRSLDIGVGGCLDCYKIMIQIIQHAKADFINRAVLI